MKHAYQVFCCLCVLVAGCGGGGGSSAPPAPVVTVTPSAASVMVGQQIQLVATINGETEPLTWSSSNAAVATVNSTGLVSALTLGQVTITATSGGGSGSAALTTTTGIVFNTITTGKNHTCGMAETGVAYCWGDNSSGQLGNGTTTNSATPVPISAPMGVGQNDLFASISAGGNHTCAIQGGFVYCWGDNSSGELGNGSTTNSATPVLVPGEFLHAAVSAGEHHTCGVLGSQAPLIPNLGIINCWGDNTYGQLGNGTTTGSATPVPVTVPSSIVWGQVSAGSTHTCSLYEPFDAGIYSTAVYC